MTTLGRLLGVDFGSVRIGLSLSDPLAIIATPYDTIPCDAQATATIARITDQERVILIVVGMPLNLKGEKGTKAQEVDEFIDRLRATVRVEVVVWDERFTTMMARQTIIDLGTKQKKRRAKDGKVDAMAAALILQGYLDSTKHSRVC